MIKRNADAAVKFVLDLNNKSAIKGITETETKANALSQKFSKAGKTLTLGLTTPMMAFGVYAIKTSADFDKASNQMRASLGATSTELKGYEEIMRNIYNANFGESYEDVANAIASVSKNLEGLNSVSLQSVTESAITLRDTFGIDINQSVRSVKALMTNFGITAEESMNLLAQGLTSNLNYSDEFIDNINEYSVQFGKLGLTAEDMFDIFQSGANAGAWNLDKIGDAVKEFSIRAIDGSQTTAEGFKALGMDADVMAQKFASGGNTAKQAFYEVITALGEMDDPVAQSIAGVNLFGTMWEDLGPNVVTQLGSIRGQYDQTTESMQKMKDVKYDDLGSMLEALKRTLGDVALEVGNNLMPTIESAVGVVSRLSKWFSNLSDGGKKTVMVIAGIIASLGPLSYGISSLITIGSGIAKLTTGFVKFFGVIGKGVVTLGKFALSLAKISINFIKLALQATIATAKLVAQKVVMLAQITATKLMTAAQWLLNAAMSANPITLIIIAITAVIAAIVLLWNKCEWFRNAVMSVIMFIWNLIKTYVGFYITIFKGIWNAILWVINKIKNGFTTVVNFLKSLFSKYINFYVSIFKKIWNGVKWVIDKIKSGFSYMADKVKSIFNGIKDTISSIMNKVIGVVKTPINWAISGLNTLIGGINKIPGINIPKIPALATGTNYIQREGLAYLHEGEAVVPKKYNPAIGGYGNNYQPNITIIADMDVNKFGKAFVRDIKTFSGGAKNSYNYGGSK